MPDLLDGILLQAQAMTQTFAITVLAANFEVVGIIIVIVISILSWLANYANKVNQPAQPPPRQPRRPPDDKLGREIDAFLQEVAGRRRPAEPAEPVEPVEIEIVPENEIRKRVERRPVRTVVRPRPRPVAAPRPARPAESPRRVRPGQELAERHTIDPSRLGTSLQSHLSNYMEGDRIEKETQQRLKHEVEQSVERHLGTFGTTVTTAETPHPARHLPQNAGDMVRLLRDPAGVQQAILINEVLQKPLGLRKR